MKKLYTLIVALLLTVITFAQAPEKMSYQAVVRDASNAFVKDTQVGMQISILQGSASGTAVYVETQTPTTNTNGLVSLEIGTGTTTDDFTSINWSTGTYFIKTETDPTGVTTNYTITSISQLMSVPFALHTKQAANGLPAGGTDGQILAINGSGVPEWTNPSTGQTYYLDTDDDGYGDINNPIVAFAMPIGYVDNNTDCNDNDITINPDSVWYIGVDTDGDTFFGSTTSLIQCDPPGLGYTTTAPATPDCDDSIATGFSVHPGIIEVVGNGIDDDCDGEIDEVPVAIGDLIEGGIVFWVDGSGHGLVCMLVADEKDLTWYDAMTTVYTNTDTGTGVYSNWYVPSMDELQLMYTNLKRFGCYTNTPENIDFDNCATEKGNFSSYYYWCTMDFDSYSALCQNFGSGSQIITNKDFTNVVRAVRAF